MNKPLDLSLILACYNEGSTLKRSLEKILNVLEDTKFTYEVICIDDKSSDDTHKTLKEFVKSQENWNVFFHDRNRGRGATVKEGMLKAIGEVVGYIDVDLEVSATYIPEFVRQIRDGSDIVIATRIYKTEIRNLIRSLSTVCYTTLSRLILNHNLIDTEAGYKFFSKKRILPVLEKCKNKYWFFDTEILIRGLDSGLKISQIPVLFLKREDKKSTVNLISDSLKYLKAMSEFKKRR